MNIAFIVEGDSDEIIFNTLKNYLKNKNIQLEIVPTYGKSNMLKKARKHYKACKCLHNAEYVIFFPDLDNDICPEIIKNNICVSENNDVKVNVIVKELEAWILADQDCISSTLNISYHSSGFTDEIIKPKVKLCNIVRKNLGYNPSEIECAKLFSQKFSIERSKELNNSANRLWNFIENLSMN